MLKRLSSQFGKKDKNKERANGQKVNGVTNGVNGVDGVNGSNRATNGTEVPGKATAPTAYHEKSDHEASRKEVESSFTAFAHLVHAAQRPLPNQSGDGTYIEEKAEHSSLWGDIRSLGFKDAKTLGEVMKNTASGANVDDKGMLMERVIQVSHLLLLWKTSRTNDTATACLCITSNIENTCRPDKCVRRPTMELS